MGKHDITDKEKIFRDSIGQKATVHREDIGGDAAERHTRSLIQLGEETQKADDQLKHYEYIGSAAVHVYVNKTLGHVGIITNAQPFIIKDCPEMLAIKAFDDLLRKLKETYGKRHGKLRSGF